VSKAKQEERRETIALLAERFPQCFSVDGNRKPLKIGIHADILAALDGTLKSDQLRRALAAYTGVAGYLREIVPGAVRRDLNGRSAGLVSYEEAADAKARMARKSKQAIHIATEAPLVPSIAPIATCSAPRPKRLSLADLRVAGRLRRDGA
jgi:sRNA-binding protein